MAVIKKPTVPPLPMVVFANLRKWQTLRDVSDEKVAAVLGVKDLNARMRKLFLTIEEMERLCALLQIEPEKLLER